jgi:hypothetical protein
LVKESEIMEQNVQLEENKKRALNVGLVVLIMLAVLTLGEYLMGSIASTWFAPLMFVALIKAFFIVRDYMHLSRVFEGDEEVH